MSRRSDFLFVNYCDANENSFSLLFCSFHVSYENYREFLAWILMVEIYDFSLTPNYYEFMYERIFMCLIQRTITVIFDFNRIFIHVIKFRSNKSCQDPHRSLKQTAVPKIWKIALTHFWINFHHQKCHNMTLMKTEQWKNIKEKKGWDKKPQNSITQWPTQRKRHRLYIVLW